MPIQAILKERRGPFAGTGSLIKDLPRDFKVALKRPKKKMQDLAEEVPGPETAGVGKAYSTSGHEVQRRFGEHEFSGKTS